jgi:hypothetical protein
MAEGRPEPSPVTDSPDTVRERRYQAIFESAIDFAIITTDRQGLVTDWNTGAGRPAMRSCGVKILSTGCPSISAADQPRIRPAPVFQSVTSPWRSVVMMAKSTALSKIA